MRIKKSLQWYRGLMVGAAASWSRRVLAGGGLVLGLSAVGTSFAQEGDLGNAVSAVKPATEEWASLRERTFLVVWNTVNESYFDPTFGGVDWAAVREKYRVMLPSIDDANGLRRLLSQMLHELGRSHFSIQAREMAVFTPAERVRIGTSGADVVMVEGQVAVNAVKAGSPAERAGLRLGDVIVAIDDWRVDQLIEYLEQADLTPAKRSLYVVQFVAGRLNGAVGSASNLVVKSGGDEARAVKLGFEEHTGEWSEPMGDYPSVPILYETTIDGEGIGYLRFNVFARQPMKKIRELLRSLPEGGGLVIDLRGNPGGLTVMSSGISGWLSDKPFQLGTMNLRQGHIGLTASPQTGAFLGPVALLIDSCSASTSEIMAAGLQEAGRARIFGAPSPGVALPSLFKALPTGDMLQYAIADMQTPHGVLIEGRGVTPDEIVTRSLADVTAGRDPVLDAARDWLKKEAHRSTSSGAVAK